MESSLSKEQIQVEVPSKVIEETNGHSTTKDPVESEVCEYELVDSDNDSWSTVDSINLLNTSLNSETKNLYFEPIDASGANNLEELDTFSQIKKLPQLRSIDIDLTHSIEDADYRLNVEIADTLNRILKAGAGSIESITLRTPIGGLPGLVFPVMKRVVALNLLFYWYGSDATIFTAYLRGGKIFPKGFKFAVMPNLRAVAIDLETEGQGPQYHSRFDCWNNNLKFCGIAKRVLTIQYNDDCGFSKQRLKTTFRNARWMKYSDCNDTYSTSEEDPEEASPEEESENEKV